MHRYYFQRIGLCDEQGDAPQTTGGGVATPTGEPPPNDPKAEASTQPEAKPSVIDSAINLLRSKASITAELTGLKDQVGVLSSERDALKTQVTALITERDGLKAEQQRLADALDTAKLEATSVGQSTVAALASLGVPESTLPQASVAGETLSKSARIEQINKQIETETDQAKRTSLRAEAYKIWKNN